jgi:7-cyano-7-deazaguanine synthase
MCSISGAILPLHAKPNIILEVEDILNDVILKGEDRGRDSWGYTEFNEKGEDYNRKWLDAPSKYFGKRRMTLGLEPAVVINNNRAEPTTEYVELKRYSDVQPYTHNGWHVVHNGTIANDKDICERYGFRPETYIDSAVLPYLLNERVGKFDPQKIAEVLTYEVIGSYATAIVHSENPAEMVLAANYKPLYIAYHPTKHYAIFTSLETYLSAQSLEDRLESELKIVQVPPYTAVHVTRHVHGLRFTEYSLKKETQEQQKALVVCSGGLDSTVVAAEAKKQGYDVTLLHFKYKCRAEEKEVAALEAIGRRLDVDTLFVETDIFKEVIGGSRLTGTLEEIADGEAGAEFAHEWVPARNLIMLSLAVGIAEAKGFSTIMLGNNLEESGAYPDNEMEFIQKLNSVLPYATQVDKHVHIEMPVGNLMKHEIVKLGLENGAPLDLTWSCYEAGEKHCGRCGPCFMRKTAFKINKAQEVIEYDYKL